MYRKINKTSFRWKVCSRIYEEKIFVSRETYELIKRVAGDLDAEPWVYSNLEFLIMQNIASFMEVYFIFKEMIISI